MLMALQFAVGPSYEVVIAAGEGGAEARAMLDELGWSFLPNTVMHFVRPQSAAAVAEVAE